MTTKPKAQKFRIRRNSSTASAAAATSDPPPQQAAPSSPHGQAYSQGAAQAMPDSSAMTGTVDTAQSVASETDIDAIRQEGLTGRQLRMARRVAQKNGLAVTSDFDAVRQLRQQGIDPFQRANVLELVTPNDAQTQAAAGQMQAATAKVPADQAKVQLPQTIQRQKNLPSTQVGPGDNPAERRAGEIRRIQRDIAKRRRRNLASLMGRLGMFVILPTIAAGWYFFVMATPMYGTKSEFVIQQAESSGASGLGGLFQGTGLATQTDSTTVQSYITSREAFIRLDDDHGFIEHFSNPDIDAIQRLDEDASRESAYGVFQDHVQVGYDPTEGILKMEVIAASPDKSQEFSEALIGYAEEQVDQLTQRVRSDQMEGAQAEAARAEIDRQSALAALVEVQERIQQPDATGATAALQQRITTLQIELDQERLNLASLLNNRRPNEAQVNAVETQISLLEGQIDLLRGQLSSGDGGSIVSNNALLRQAEENYLIAVQKVQSSLASLDTARIEANRQVRYMSISVAPIAPDEATYPKSFENTLLAFLIFSGIYLMISLTASILREQVSS
ncbi:capsule biosynthesis protein [Octadecabacter sp. 1_MG-2023]|uniref:capsule biosynthesis protein n=1 Tax=unclassified Octadecabacter TaxID=196158 RepID=UPI001C0837AC|nr:MULTISPECIES: capsule biosynthesis protein [unclassified Octadecabacter]MBU2994429.1 capsule biosynthesis protein [Octadecabacter sp. B2R22]MDO6734280.1 capsule biosynthesis protein [Octadecabacter sp. 1_MG-2023]